MFGKRKHNQLEEIKCGEEEWRMSAIADAIGTLHSIGTVQTACRLKRAVLQGHCTALVLCRQLADRTELCYRDIAQHWYCADSLQTEQSCATGI